MSKDISLAEEVAVMDMWYGSHEWRDKSIPLAMDLSLSNPAYVDHILRVEREEAGQLMVMSNREKAN